MGPQTNNIQESLGNPNPTKEQLGLTTSTSSFSAQRSSQKPKKWIFILSASILAILVLITLFILFRPKRLGSGNKDDLIKFIKLYQYGNMDEKKDINLNLPANYSYAYRILDESFSSEDQFSYANQLYSAYQKFSDQNPIADLLFLYKNNAQLTSNTIKIREAFFQGGEESSKELIKQYTKDYHSIKTKYVEEKNKIIKKYLDGQVSYLKSLKAAGCIENQSLDIECEDRVKQDENSYPEVSEAASEVTGLDNEIIDNYKELIVVINNAIIESYKTNVLNKETKK